VVTDVAAAVNFLWSRAQPLTSLVLVGSSIGSNAALRVAADNSNVNGVVLLSPGLNYRGIDMGEPMERYEASGRAALLFAGADDTASAAAVRAYTSDDVAHGGVSGEVFPGTSAHGVALAAPGAHPELWDRIATWVHERLEAPANTLNPSLPSSVDGGRNE
jgi:dienelactone hydrolase